MKTSTKVVLVLSAIIIITDISVFGVRYGDKKISDDTKANLNTAVILLSILSGVWFFGLGLHYALKAPKEVPLEPGLRMYSSRTTLDPTLADERIPDPYPLTRRDSNLSSTGNWSTSQSTLGNGEHLYPDDMF